MQGEILTPDRLRELFSYDVSTGKFHARTTTHGGRWAAGRRAGTKSKAGYRSIQIGGVLYLEHRLAWLYVYSEWPTNVIDHIDGNPENNKLENLRDVDQRTNAQNNRKASSAKKYSDLIGAQWCKQAGKWKTSIRLNGKTKHLGFFASDELASDAYKKAKRAMHPGACL